MDLIGGYLLVILILFAGNISLLIGNYKINNLKLSLISIAFFIITFLFLNISFDLNLQLFDYMGYIFLIIMIFIIIAMLFVINNQNYIISASIMVCVFIFSIFLISSQCNLDFFSRILYSIFAFLIVFIVYQITKLLHYAKRQYYVIIGEYMCLFSILLFIFSITYDSIKTIDYSMFSSFLILTPTYQLIYVVLAIVFVFIIGVLINDRGGKS